MISRKTRRLISLIISLIIIVFLFPSVSAEKDGKTKVVFRVKWVDDIPHIASILTGKIYEYYDLNPEHSVTNEEHIGNNDHTITIKPAKWETAMYLSPGFYRLESLNNGIITYDHPPIYGNTDVFEVKGDIMYVYVNMHTWDQEPEEPLKDWLIYGEDTRDFWIWGTGYYQGVKILSDEEIAKMKEEDPVTYSWYIGELHWIDSEIEETETNEDSETDMNQDNDSNGSENDSQSTDDKNANTDKEGNEQKTDKASLIGDIIVAVLIGSTILGAGVVLLIIKRKKDS